MKTDICKFKKYMILHSLDPNEYLQFTHAIPCVDHAILLTNIPQRDQMCSAAVQRNSLFNIQSNKRKFYGNN